MTVVLFEPVGLRLENALSPGNDSERLLYRNLFQNLIRLDCGGSIRPGLADAWTTDSGGNWTFTLRKNARLMAGWPATADQVASGIESSGIAAHEDGSIDSAAVLDDRHVRIHMRSRDSLPRLLADPALAVLTGMASQGEKPGGIEVPGSEGAPHVDFEFDPDGDPRDALDRGADLVVTRDPALVDYVALRPELATFPLPWSRTYVMLQPYAAEQLPLVLSDSARRSLAADAVSAVARAAEPPYWWSDIARCRSTTLAPSGLGSSRVVYPKDDDVARALAERIVALAPVSARLRAVGLSGAEFVRAVRGGSERAYVIGLPRQSLAPCRDASMWPAGTRLLPLVDTRAYAIVRKGAPPLSVEWDGTVRVVER